MLNRRGFFGATVGALAVAWCPRPAPRYYKVRYVEYTSTIGPNTAPLTLTHEDDPALYYLGADGPYRLSGGALKMIGTWPS